MYVPQGIQIQISKILFGTGNRILLKIPSPTHTHKKNNKYLNNITCNIKMKFNTSCRNNENIGQRSIIFYLSTSLEDNVPSIRRQLAGKIRRNNEISSIRWSSAIIWPVINLINTCHRYRLPLPLIVLLPLFRNHGTETRILTRSVA